MTQLFELVSRYTNWVMELKNKLTLVKSAAAKKAERDAAIIKSLWEWVNLLHNEID